MPITAQTVYQGITDHEGTWGTDIRAFQTTALGSINDTTICSCGTAVGATIVTADPLTNRSTTGDNRADFGWAIREVGEDSPNEVMDSTATAKRIIPAGTWLIQTRLIVPAGSGVGGSVSAFTQARCYRVSSSGTRSELFTWPNGGTVTSGILGPQEGDSNATSASQPEIVLEADETIHVGYYVSASQVVGSLGSAVGKTVTVRLGPVGNVPLITVPSPGIRTNHLPALTTIAGEGTPTRVVAPAIPRNAVGEGTPTYSRVPVISKTTDVVGEGTPTKGILDLAVPRSLVGDGVQTHTKSVSVLRTFDLAGDGALARTVAVALARDTVGEGTPTYARAVVAAKTFDLAGDGVVTEIHPLTASRVFNLVGDGVPTRVLAVAEDFDVVGEAAVTSAKATVAARIFSLGGEGTVARDGLIVAVLERSVVGEGLVTELHPLTANRTFALVGEGAPVNNRIELPLDDLPEEGGGGDIIIVRKSLYLFDD